MRYLLIAFLFINQTLCYGVNAKAYGAKGDGVQEDTPYLNAAITIALLLGEDLFIPAGTYKCNEFSFESNILKMDQNGAKTIRIYGEKGTKITTSQPRGCLFYIFYSNIDVVIDSIFFENTHGITMQQTNAIILAGTHDNAMKNFTIKNCRFEGFSTAISPQGVRGLTIRENVFASPKGHDNAQNNSQPAVFIWLADNENGQCYDVQILNNQVNGFTGTDISRTVTKRPMDGFVFGFGYGVTVQGNTTRNLCEEHIAFRPSVMFPLLNKPIVIKANNFYLSLPYHCVKDSRPLVSNYGVRADCNNVTIASNNFYDYTLGVLIYPYHYPTLQQHDFVISRNNFYAARDSLSNVTEAIKVQGSRDKKAYTIVVYKNIITVNNVKFQSSRAAIAIYDCNNINIQYNDVKAGKNNLNGFLFSGILTERCTNIINLYNLIRIE